MLLWTDYNTAIHGLVSNWALRIQLKGNITLNCGAIKQNESEFEHITFLVFHLVLFSIYIATFYRKPHLNWTCHCKVMTYWKVVKTIEKRIYFLCLALSPNQYLWIPTHFAWSHHNWYPHMLCRLLNILYSNINKIQIYYRGAKINLNMQAMEGTLFKLFWGSGTGDVIWLSSFIPHMNLNYNTHL